MKTIDYDTWKCTPPKNQEDDDRLDYAIRYADQKEEEFRRNPANQNVDIDEDGLYEVWLAEGEADYDEMIIRDSEDYFDFDDFRLGA